MKHRDSTVPGLPWALIGILPWLFGGAPQAAGIQSGTEITVAQDTARLDAVAIAGNPGNRDYLVVWARAASGDSPNRLMGQRVTAKRRVGAAFVIHEFTGDNLGPSPPNRGEPPELSLIFAPSNDYLLAYSVKGLDGQFKEIRLARLGADAATVTEDIPLRTASGAHRPTIAAYYGADLVTWTEPGGIVGRRYQPNGNPPLGPIETYAGPGGDFAALAENLDQLDAPFIAFQGLATRRPRGGASIPALSLVPIDPLGLATDTPILLTRGAERPAATFLPSNGRTAFVWAKPTARGVRRVATARLRTTKLALTPSRILAVRAESPTIRGSGRDGETLALWVKQSNRRIQAQLLLPGLETKSVVSTFGRRRVATTPSVAMSPDRKLALVAWAENDAPGRRNRVVIQGLDTSGDTPAMTIRMTPSEQKLSFKSTAQPGTGTGSSGSGLGSGSGSGSASPGPKTLSYTLSVSNTSAVRAQGPSVSLNLGDLQGADFAENVTCEETTCKLPDLAPGASFEFKVTGQIAYSGCSTGGGATPGRQKASATLNWRNSPQEDTQQKASAADVALTC